jgi:outer membrane protein assembly factor BamE (lipoprotein component of BamABCDE complex)
MGRRLTIAVIASLVTLLSLSPSCKKQRVEKPPDPTYDRLEQRYGKAVAQASKKFKSLTPEDKGFYEGGGKMHQADTLLRCLEVGMSRAEIKELLGEPSNTRTTRDRERWGYTLSYSQALVLEFDPHGRLTGLDGYGADEWKEADKDLSQSPESEARH